VKVLRWLGFIELVYSLIALKYTHYHSKIWGQYDFFFEIYVLKERNSFIQQECINKI